MDFICMYITIIMLWLCHRGMSAWNDRLHPSDNWQFVVVALRALAHPFRHHLPHRVSTPQRQPWSVPAGRSRRGLRWSASVPVEPRATVPLLASLAGNAAQPPEMLSNGCPLVSHGGRWATVCQGRPAGLSSVSQVFPETSVWLLQPMRLRDVM